MTCAPILDTPETGFVTETSAVVFNENVGEEAKEVEVRERFFYYGPSRGVDDWTFYEVWENSSAREPYSLDSYDIYSNATTTYAGDLYLAPGLTPKMGDLTVTALVNMVNYTDPFNDTIFGTEDYNNYTGKRYGRRFSVLGCKQQYQFCNPVNGVCTLAGGWYDIGNETEDHRHFKLWNDDGLTPLQHGTISNIRMAAGIGSLNHIHSALGPDALLAMRRLANRNGHVSGPLEPNQTRLELENWFATRLAALQIQFILQPSVPALQYYDAVIRNSSLGDLCHRHMMRNADYTSISVLGLTIVLIFGGLLIVASLVLPSLVGLLRERFGTDTYARKEWDAVEVLNLQRKYL